MANIFSIEEASKVRLKDGLGMVFCMPLERGPKNNAPPANVCIFCGNLESSELNLTDEHVVPDGLGWDLVIPKATCSSCQRKINPFEQRAIKSWFGFQREIFDIKSKKSIKRKSPSENHIGAIRSDSKFIGTMPIAELHLAGRGQGRTNVAELLENGGLYPVFDLPPGVLLGRDQNENLRYRIESHMNWKKIQEQVVSVALNGVDFFRLIAKIAHCFAYIFSYSNQMEFTLPKFILGEDWTRSSYWIGSSELSFGTETLHLIAIHTRKIRLTSAIGFYDIIAVVVTIGLFAGKGAPYYDVVVGYLK